MQKTRDLGAVVGTGEGIFPTWALPGIDFFEGLMSLRTYADSRLKISSGDYETDLGDSYRDNAAITLDETRRVLLYQLAFHDYVAGTWVWRDTNFQSCPYAWKKDLFDILCGTMPMWHIDRKLWDSHKDDYVASYRAIAPVRSRIGFAGLLITDGLLRIARSNTRIGIRATESWSILATSPTCGQAGLPCLPDHSSWRRPKPLETIEKRRRPSGPAQFAPPLRRPYHALNDAQVANKSPPLLLDCRQLLPRPFARARPHRKRTTPRHTQIRADEDGRPGRFVRAARVRRTSHCNPKASAKRGH